MQSRILIALALLTASACATFGMRGHGDERGFPGLDYQLITRITDSIPQRLESRVMLHNATRKSLLATVPACALDIELFRDSSKSSKPVWQSSRQAQFGNPTWLGRVCTSYLTGMEAGPDYTFSSGDLSYSITVNEILGDSLPDGRYWIEGLADVNKTRARIKGGEVILTRRK